MGCALLAQVETGGATTWLKRGKQVPCGRAKTGLCAFREGLPCAMLLDGTHDIAQLLSVQVSKCTFHLYVCELLTW